MPERNDTRKSSLENVVDPELWYADLKQCYRSAASRTTEEERCFEIANLIVRFRFAGNALQRIYCPAFEHLACRAADSQIGKKPDLTVHFFVESDAQTPLPPPPGGIADFSPRGDIRGFNNENCKAAFQPFGKILSSYLIGEKQAILCVGDLDSVYNFERAAPIRPILGWLMREHGRQLAHGAVVAHQGQGLLLAGKSGSGKSNTALASIGAGLQYLSDDFCAVASTPEQVAYSLFGTGRTKTEDLARLPFLEALTDQLEDFPQDKELYLLNRHFPERVVAKCMLKAVLLPKVAPSHPLSLTPVSQQQALLSLAPITTTLLPDAGPEVLARLGAIVRSLPCYRLNLGPEIEAVPLFLRETILRLSKPSLASESQ
ncbi:hypothetical protein N8675_03440 [Akkermansiaceae bacterium]|nr:hypothetical protein [Akkermansiaceae bacterium]MDA8961358.1 hypothetical protein [bacterium]MDB4501615.1 hypothetical protein [Akkermansiaceae bacterium]MDB4618707.1 hypothetical protein [bacterium]MDC0278354.1 hypothetical protein [Akkermansiaceae bacterium]